MPTISQEILMMLCEGAFRLLTFRSLFSFGWLSNYPTYYRTIERLEKDGLLLREKQARDVCLRLTDQGKLLLGKHRQCRRESHQAWDRRWRLVIFDVPEKRKDVRPRLRRFLSALGFGRVQKSVWMAPYDYEKQVQEFARRLDMHQYIFQMTVERFRGLDKRELAGSFWDIRGLHDQYQSLIQSYSKEMALLPAAAEGAEILRKRFFNNLMWDYHSILARDPQLPDELLPTKWGGAAAKQFVNHCRRVFSRNLT